MADAAGVVQKNPANVSNGKHIHNYSTFDRSLSYRKWNTLRFGDYTPSFEMEGVPSDEISLNSLDRVDSLSLKAPFKGSIRKIKESFMVPNMAILPKTWDRIYAQNSNGDDVPADANCIVENWPAECKSLFTAMWNIVNNAIGTLTTSNVDAWFTALIRTLILGEMMYSRGSLLNVSGYRLGSSLVEFSYDGDYHSYDEWFDRVITDVFSKVYRIDVTIPVGSSSVTRTFVGLSSTPNSSSIRSSFRSMLELFRENLLCTVTVWPFTDFDAIADLNTYLSDLKQFGASLYQLPIFKSVLSSVDSSDPTSLNSSTLNLSRLLAYQLVCAHFYTNSSIDFIYSAELYREYIGTLIRGYLVQFNAAILDGFYKYSWNGLKLDYDYLSGHLLSQALFYTGTTWHNNRNFVGTSISVLGGSLSTSGNVPYLGCLPVWNAIFSFRKSLRYGDYFTASRPRPLAPINTDVSVNNSMVSVVDITRNIQAQRFANAVMRSRSKIEEYVKSLFNKAPEPDYHNPFFLARSEEMIFGDEVQNTAEVQVSNPNSRTANFAGNVSPYTFTFHNDDMHPCVYLQIIGFDVKRAYSRSVDRQFLHRDRFDMFNPDFQYIGDQAVYGVELGYPNSNDEIPAIFSYQTRDMEYKQRFDVVSGGFVDFLPGWCLTDIDRSRIPTSSIDPDFIRSYNTELDQFYLSLTGFSLGSYFHFTCITDNNVRAKRPMAVDPQILA